MRPGPDFLQVQRALTAEPRPAPASLEDKVALLSAEREISETLVAYGVFYDAVDLDALTALFTEDAELSNLRGTHVGSAAIRANYEALTTVLAQSMHFVTNVTIRVDGDDSARAASYLYSLALRRSDGVAYGSGGTYADELVRRPDGWKIAKRRITGEIPHLLTGFTPTYDVPPPTTPPTGS